MEYLTSFQAESRSSNEEYNAKSRQMHTELEGFKQEKRTLRDRVVRVSCDLCQVNGADANM